MIRLGIDREKLKFVSISTVYDNSNGTVVVTNPPRKNPTLRKIYVKYH